METQKQRKARFTQCLGCAEDNYDNDEFNDYQVTDLNQKIWLCSSCRDDMVGFFNWKQWVPPPRTFLARPLRKKSIEDRQAFKTLEEFETWCTEQSDFLEDCGYTFGISVDRSLTSHEITKFLNNGTLNENIYWLNEHDVEDPENWNHLITMYRHGDCEFSSLDHPGSILSLDLDKYFKFLTEKHQRQQNQLNKNKELMMDLFKSN